MSMSRNIEIRIGNSREVFEFYDINKDEKISKSELVEAMKLLGEEISEDFADLVISKVDKSRDGKVDFEEFKEWRFIFMRDGVKDL